MSDEELMARLSGPFRACFALQMADEVRAAGVLEMLYRAATARHEALKADVRSKVLFRAAYVLETVVTADPAAFDPFAGAFCRDFAACDHPGARRHFTKIMSQLLRRYDPGAEALERIAEAAAGWAVDPDAKVAVRIGSVEVLRCCRGRVGWVDRIWDDLLETLGRDPSPGIACRMRKGWRG